ncbi:MAG: amidohydrolase [Endomicrobium sp.]|jgi:amidohydrolase|nr:amidohydrolase [Endomicrobium sp.]
MTIDQEIIDIRRHLHKNPELSGNEFKTAKFIESKLKGLKILCKCIGKTGVIGTLKCAKFGKTIALRADMDALPIYEGNNVEYRSKKTGIMHACGHDGHVSIVLGVAMLLQKKNELSGNIRFIFQPSEETSEGAKIMIKNGALREPDVDFILGTHVNPWIKSNKIGLKFGAMMAAVDELKIEIIGEIAHGAYPHKGKDAIVASSGLINMIQCIISRELNPLENAVITFGKIEGGNAYNVICKKVKVCGTIRTFNKKTRNFIKSSISKKLKAVEMAYGVKCIIDYNEIGTLLVNTYKITKACVKTAEKFYGKDNVEILEKPSMGGEDFAEYLKIIPGNFIYVGTSKNKYTSYPWHHTNFNIDESALPKAAKYIAYTINELLK